MNQTQLAPYRDEIRRLHHDNDTLRECNGVLLGAIEALRGDHAAELHRIKAEMAPGFAWPDSGGADELEATKVKLAEVTAERDELLRRYAHHNTSGKNSYTEMRSNVNRDMKAAEEAAVDLADGAAVDGAADGATTTTKEVAAPVRGTSHSNRPHRKIWYAISRCGRCGRSGCLKKGPLICRLINDFDGDDIYIRTVAHMGRKHTCGICGHQTLPDMPSIPGTSFGPKALGFIVQFSSRKSVDRDTVEYLRDMFGFKTGETTIWNGRKAAADLVESTMEMIMDELKRAKFLGIDETYYSVNGKKGYVWVVRTDRATLVIALPTRSGQVIPTHMAELLDKPVTTDGYSPYLTYFKILQRCWAHILRGAEAAYVRAPKGPRQDYYRSLYDRLLDIFRDAKKAARAAEPSGGADHQTCLAFERRVLEVAASYGDDHDFAGTLAKAAPNLFTFLRYPGMPPTNNATERDIRDVVVIRRKNSRKFVNEVGMRVFSILQSFASTCRKLGLVPWMCVERMASDPGFNPYEAGPELSHAPAGPAPGPSANPVSVLLDGNLVEEPDGGWSPDAIAALEGAGATVPGGDIQEDAVPGGPPPAIESRPPADTARGHLPGEAPDMVPTPESRPGGPPCRGKPPPAAVA